MSVLLQYNSKPIVVTRIFILHPTITKNAGAFLTNILFCAHKVVHWLKQTATTFLFLCNNIIPIKCFLCSTSPVSLCTELCSDVPATQVLLLLLRPRKVDKYRSKSFWNSDAMCLFYTWNCSLFQYLKSSKHTGVQKVKIYLRREAASKK